MTTFAPYRAILATTRTSGWKNQIDSRDPPLPENIHNASRFDLDHFFPKFTCDRALSNVYRNSAPIGDVINNIAAGPSKIMRIEGKMSNAMGKTILIGAL